MLFLLVCRSRAIQTMHHRTLKISLSSLHLRSASPQSPTPHQHPPTSLSSISTTTSLSFPNQVACSAYPAAVQRLQTASQPEQKISSLACSSSIASIWIHPASWRSPAPAQPNVISAVSLRTARSGKHTSPAFWVKSKPMLARSTPR